MIFIGTLALFAVMLFLPSEAMAQEAAEEYYRYKIEREESFVESYPDADTLLFGRARLSAQDLFDEITSYRLSFVEYSRRGFSFTSRSALVDGIATPRRNIPLLHRLSLGESCSSLEAGLYSASQALSQSDDAAGVDEFTSLGIVPLDGGAVGVNFSGKSYLGGVRASLHKYMGQGWSSSLYLAGRGGDDIYIKGLYQNSIDMAFRLGKSYLSGGAISFVALCSISERALRAGSTAEVFTLRGDNLYNPLWGRQEGKIRSSRIRRDAVPFFVGSYSGKIGSLTRFRLSAGGEVGKRSYSSLGWYGAMTPRPDNYRYLPSYFEQESIAQSVAEQWRVGNERYTQVDWSELYTVNRLSERGAVYAVADRVERVLRGELSLQFHSQLSDNLTLRYGVNGSYSAPRYYQQMNDLLGATYFDDIDYYLADDDTYSHSTLNNLRQSSSRITEGEKFAYDYALMSSYVGADVGLEYLSEQWIIDLGVGFGGAQLYRRGYFEKELYRGDASYGNSRKSKFSPYRLHFEAHFSPSTPHSLSVKGLYGESAPNAEDILLNPQYNNRVVDNPSTSQLFAAEFNYRYTTPSSQFHFSAYYSEQRNLRETLRSYDDLSATYCNVDVSGLGVARYGVEVASRVELSRSLRLSAAATLGRFVYSQNPLLSLYADADNSIVSSNSESYLGSCYVGGAPQIAAVAGVEYFSQRGWILSCDANFVAERYVDASYIRRTELVAREGSASEEIYRSMLDQQRLDNAFTLDASLSRWFYVGEGSRRVAITLAVNNILGSNDIIRGGYEPSRLHRHRSGAHNIYSPMANVLTYAYPRTYYATISYKF